MAQRYVFVLADDAGMVLDETSLISQKVQQMKNPSKASSTSGVSSTPAAGPGALQVVGGIVDGVAALSSDASTASGLTQESPSGDWVDLLADAAPAVGSLVGSVIPGVGTVVGGVIGTGISLANKLLD